jgi:hypothetical protein
MRVKVRRGKFGISQCLAFFLVIIFTNAAASESMAWSETFKEGRLDLAHWQPAVGRDCRDCSASVVNATERGDFRPGLLGDTLGTQDESVRFVGTNIPHQSNRTNLTDSIKLVEFRDNFNAGYLDPERWKIIQEGDVRQNIIDVIFVDPIKQDEYRLRLGMNTIGTRDDTVKYIGIRSVNKLSFHAPGEISFDLDWNNQRNGCYLTAAIYLCPTVANTNPEREEDWLRFEYIGVPPGQSARAVITIKDKGTVKHLYTEGWPEERRGRHIGFQRIKITLDTNGFTILENGALIYHVDSMNLKFESIYLYLMMSSHSNYPFREIYFDNISVLQK